jgi:SAM-dependent methyltransferase
MQVDALAARGGVDRAYANRWCEAAYAFGLLARTADRYVLTALGDAFRPSAPGTLMPFAVQSVLGAHVAERAAGLLRTGERPGERVLAERPSILPWFGPMLEASFAAPFERELLPVLLQLSALDRPDALAVDLGCGNGWYLRRLLARRPSLRGLGLDGFDENVRQATAAAAREGLSERARFECGDIYDFSLETTATLIAMNRALHHVWDRRDDVLPRLARALAPGGAVVVWEPAWPGDVNELADERRRGMAFGNLNEHVQGNRFLQPSEIVAALSEVGLTCEVRLLAEGTEAVIVGTKPSTSADSLSLGRTADVAATSGPSQ